MIIGYSKIGRSMTMDSGKYGFQGDAEAPQLLTRLARRNPDHIFAVVGKHTKKPPTELFPSNVFWPWVHFDGDEEQVVAWASQNLEANIVHLGQHGTSHQRIPMVNNTWAEVIGGLAEPTTPLSSLQSYGGFLTRILNAVGDRTGGTAPAVYLCTDPRNYLKARDVKWPTGFNRILSQHAFSREQNHERFNDPAMSLPGAANPPHVIREARGGELYIAQHTYRHGGLELMILPDDWETWGSRGFDDRSSIGVASTSAWEARVDRRRSALIARHVLDQNRDAEVFGKWDDRCVADLPEGVELQTNKVEQFPEVMQRWRVTFALPAISRSTEGIGWTTAKPFQAFAARTLCLFHPELDQQGWIIPSKTPTEAATEVAPGLFSVRQDWTTDELTLARWLRVTSPDDVTAVRRAIDADPATWQWLVSAQRALLKRRWDEHFTERVIEHQLGIERNEQ